MSAPFEPKDDPALHRLLRDLPPPSAPPELMASVQAALRQRTASQAWWKQPMSAWPYAARTIMVVALLLIAGTIIFLSEAGSNPLLRGRIAAGVENQPLSSWQLGLQSLSAIGVAAKAIASTLPQAIWWAVGLTAIAFYGGCLGAGSWVYHRFVDQE